MSLYHPRPNTHYVRRSQQQRQQKQSQQISGGRWLLAGIGSAALLLGGYFAAMHFLQGRASVVQDVPTVFEKRKQAAQSPSAESVDNPETGQSASVSEPEPAAATPSFQFYRALPHARVEVDAQPLPVKLERPVQIVAGTFTDPSRAQKEQARLRRFGYQLQVVAVPRQGRTLYQLRTAVIHDRLEMIRLRNGLQKAGARVLVVQLRPQSQP